jgi:hypothetical protein
MIILVHAAGNAPALNSLINTAPLFSARRAYLSLCIPQINSTYCLAAESQGASAPGWIAAFD